MNNASTVSTAAAAPGRSRLRVTVVATTALAFAGALALSGGTAAFAHDELIASSPENGQVLEAAPAAVELDFSNDIIEVGTAIEVVDHHGEDVEVGEPVIDGPKVTATLPSDLEGEYQVRWRAVSSDGHPIEGTIDFGVGADATGTWTEEPPHDAAASDDADADHGDHGDEGDHADADDSAASGPDGWAVAGFVVGGLGIIALVVAIILNTRRRSAGPGAGDGTGSAGGTGTGTDA